MVKVKKPYTPFPPPMQPSKVDLLLESGEYFMSEKEKSLKKDKELSQRQKEKLIEKRKEKEKLYIPPEEVN